MFILRSLVSFQTLTVPYSYRCDHWITFISTASYVIISCFVLVSVATPAFHKWLYSSVSWPPPPQERPYFLVMKLSCTKCFTAWDIIKQMKCERQRWDSWILPLWIFSYGVSRSFSTLASLSKHNRAVKFACNHMQLLMQTKVVH